MHALVIDPKAPGSFWDWETIRLFGFHAMAPNLGLMTVAAWFDESVQVTYVDENIRPVTDDEWAGCDFVFTGGMLQRQERILELIDEAHQRGKRVIVGGADPTAQPQIYRDADAVVAGDLDDCDEILPGLNQTTRADITCSPVPRYDLIDHKRYAMGVMQWSRGCPQGCTFCYSCVKDGLEPRWKTPPQILAELEAIYDSGHRGEVMVVDDCIDAHPKRLQQALDAVCEWVKEYGFPFRFSCQASTRLGDNPELLAKMRACGFHAAFLGIETPDRDTLREAHKRVNVYGDLQKRVRTIHEAGLVTPAGFILGMDGEPNDAAELIVDFAEEAGIPVAMLGLLAVLPGTPLAHQLHDMGRLYDSQLDPVGPDTTYELRVRDIGGKIPDQTTGGGLNFTTTRDRRDILSGHVDAYRRLYSPDAYCERVWRQLRELDLRPVHRYGFWQQLKNDIGVAKLWWVLRKIPGMRLPMWKLIGRAIRKGGFRYWQPALERAITDLVAYPRFRNSVERLQAGLMTRLEREQESGIPTKWEPSITEVSRER